MNDNIDLTKIAEQLSASNDKLPPVDKWNPPFSGDLDMRIARDGKWYYLGSEIKRPALVKLFSSILLKSDDEYFLVTPVEKYRIVVEDKPFLAVGLDETEVSKKPCLVFTTNVGEKVVASKDNPIRVEIDALSDEPSPYLLVRKNLEALISRNVFYQLVDQAEQDQNESNELFVCSAGERFSLGRF